MFLSEALGSGKKKYFWPFKKSEPSYSQNMVPAKKIKVGTGGTQPCASGTGFRQVPADMVPANSSVAINYMCKLFNLYSEHIDLNSSSQSIKEKLLKTIC